MREAGIVAAIQKRLRARGAVVVKIHGGPLQPAVVDLLGAYQGRAFALEAKQPGKHATPRQQRVLEEWARAGAVVGVVTSADEAEALVCDGGTNGLA